MDRRTGLCQCDILPHTVQSFHDPSTAAAKDIRSKTLLRPTKQIDDDSDSDT
jgi:hypothetical protein